MQRTRNSDTPVSSTGSGPDPRRRRWRPIAWATAALMSIGLAAGFATAASAQPVPSPAANVTPGVANIGSGTTNTQFVFYTAADGSVWQKVVRSGNPATAVGGILVSGPSPIVVGSNILVFGEGTDHALWMTSCTPGGNCTPWRSLGGILTSKPGASDIDANNYSVYVRGADGAAWALDHFSTGFGTFHSIGGRLLSGTGPSAAARNGSQDVLVVGTDQGLWLQQVGVSGFFPVGGRTTASPALVNVTINNTSQLVGFARGTDMAGWWSNVSAVSGWNTMGPAFLTSGVSAAARGSTTWTDGLGANSEVFQNTGHFNTMPPTFDGWMQVTPDP